MSVKVLRSLGELRPFTSSAKLTVVDMFATWCGPCTQIAPAFKTLADRTPHVNFVKVDVDQATDVAQEYQIRAMPTFLFFRSGQLLQRMEGANYPQLEQFVAQYGKPPIYPIPDDQTLANMTGKQLLALMSEHNISARGLPEKQDLIDELKKKR